VDELVQVGVDPHWISEPHQQLFSGVVAQKHAPFPSDPQVELPS
jgi:hypothetical protein